MLRIQSRTSCILSTTPLSHTLASDLSLNDDYYLITFDFILSSPACTILSQQKLFTFNKDNLILTQFSALCLLFPFNMLQSKKTYSCPEMPLVLFPLCPLSSLSGKSSSLCTVKPCSPSSKIPTSLSSDLPLKLTILLDQLSVFYSPVDLHIET